MFAEDDNGIWRPIVTYSEARGIGDRASLTAGLVGLAMYSSALQKICNA